MSLLNTSIKITSTLNNPPKHTSLDNIIESVSNNTLSRYYQESNSQFMKKIDKLNLSFYIETEKILSRKKASTQESQGQNTLFLLLFKQITLYIGEIERLNILLKDYEDKIKLFRNEAKEEKMTRRNEMNTKDQIISALRASNNVLEEKLLEQIKSNNSLLPCSSNRRSYPTLSIESFTLYFLKPKSTFNDNHVLLTSSNNNDSIVMNGGNAQMHQKKPMNYFNIRYYSKEEKLQESKNSLTGKIKGDFLHKKKGMKIIKNVKAQYSLMKMDSIEVQSERELNGRINSDITDCAKSDYLKSQRIKQRKMLLDSCRTELKF